MMKAKAKPKHWADVEEWCETGDNSWDHCLIELLKRVETLEDANYRMRVDILRLTNAVANQVPDRGKLFADVIPDEDDDLNYLEKPESSLVEQVRDVIADKQFDPPDFCYKEAKAAILVVAKWLEDHSGGRRAAYMLEQQVNMPDSSSLRAARRPKPLSLKEQAIAVLEDAELDAAHYNILLRALE